RDNLCNRLAINAHLNQWAITLNLGQLTVESSYVTLQLLDLFNRQLPVYFLLLALFARRRMELKLVSNRTQLLHAFLFFVPSLVKFAQTRFRLGFFLR